MIEVINLLKNQLSKMGNDGSWYVGAAAGAISFVIPEWVTKREWSLQHTVLLGILVLLFMLEWFVGGRLAKLSTVKFKTSEVAIDAAIRDFMIVIMCGIAYGFDFLIQSTGSFIFVIFTLAFIYHNLYSLLANVEVLGWGKHFPMWLMNWLDNEIKAKKEKYFPDNEKKEDDK